MSALVLPDAWRGRLVPTLEVLVFIRQQILAGFAPEIFIKRLDVAALRSFVLGLHFHQFCSGEPDDGYIEFIEWLRDDCHEFPSPEGWEGYYLAACSGDHRAAMMRFLDRCDEFWRLRQSASR